MNEEAPQQQDRQRMINSNYPHGSNKDESERRQQETTPASTATEEEAANEVGDLKKGNAVVPQRRVGGINKHHYETVVNLSANEMTKKVQESLEEAAYELEARNVSATRRGAVTF